MRTGFARVKITPEMGAHLAGSGGGEKRRAQCILDDLYARVVVIEAENKKICFISLDVTIITEDYTEKIRRYAQSLGFSPEAVMVHAVQNHSAPSLGHFMLDPDFPEIPSELEYIRGGETKTYQFILEKIFEAIKTANNSLIPVSIGSGIAVNDGLAFNRRAITRDGKARMPWFFSGLQYPLGPTDIKYIEGPVDPEIGALCFRSDDMKIISAILHFTCHPVNVFATKFYAISSDWPGMWSEGIEKMFNTNPLVLNGCCGNINPWPAFVHDFYPDHKKMGNKLAEITQEIISRMTFRKSENLGFVSKKISIPLRSEPEKTIRAKEYLEKNPFPVMLKDNPERVDPEWFQATSIMSVEYARKRGDFIYEIQAFRVGDIAVLGLPGEPFVEGQLEIKINSPARYTFVAHATNQYVGYIPIKQAFSRGGHEATLCYWSKLIPEALEIIVKNSLDMLKELFPEGINE